MIIETIVLLSAIIFLWWVANSIQALQNRADRLGREVLFLEYELRLLAPNESPERPHDFVNVAHHILEDRKMIDGSKECAKQLSDWGCSVTEMTQIVKRMSLSK